MREHGAHGKRVRHHHLGPSVDALADVIVGFEEWTGELLNGTKSVENSDKFGVVDDTTLSQLDAWSFQYPILLGFGIEESNASELLEQTQLTGFALKGGNEIRPGFGDSDELMNILEILESEN